MYKMDSEVAATLDSVPYNKLTVVSLGIHANEVILPEGFGFLVPRGEGLRILGAIIISNFFLGRAPDGCAAMSIFIGGELDQSAFELDDDEILGIVKRDLRRTLHWQGEPVTVQIQRWPRISQYDMRQGERMRQIEAAEARWPGLHLLGNWRGGVSVGDRVNLTWQLHQQIGERLDAMERVDG